MKIQYNNTDYARWSGQTDTSLVSINPFFRILKPQFKKNIYIVSFLHLTFTFQSNKTIYFIMKFQYINVDYLIMFRYIVLAFSNI